MAAHLPAYDKPLPFAAGGAGGNPTYAALQGADAAWSKVKSQEVVVLVSVTANLPLALLVLYAAFSQQLQLTFLAWSSLVCPAERETARAVPRLCAKGADTTEAGFAV